MSTGARSRLADLAQRYWTRGAPGRETPPELLSGLFRLWLVALFLKVLGASWDVSWHFKWLRDDLAPPHLINITGNAIVVALVLFHGYTGYGTDRLGLRLMQWGAGIFFTAVPLDLINHRVNGLDITSWSVSHALLYLGTAVMIAGAIRAWWVDAPENRARPVVLGLLWLFFLENVWFPNQHQEYGVLSVAAWDRGSPYAEPILLQFAADQIGKPSVDRDSLVAFSLPVPDWVYPVWACTAALLVLAMARAMVGRRWTATLIAAGYVGFRAVLWPLLAGIDFPPSAVPFFFVLAALGVDLAFLLPVPEWARAPIGSVLAIGLGYGAVALQGFVLVAPPVDYGSAVPAAILLAASWSAVVWLHQRRGWHVLPARSPWPAS
ncbi:hypothetical protein [Crossiella cryophila]|uniref:Uncharacterized protein n=1 Tax=Crossiella cryophila TaxID=43355 RepID=A0A7W7FWI0_9PSEU|nr:hypothetical protein [Crossiella cryophila]MBB4677949.1 hypothetical protein [Crossiella cryophila]